MIRLLSILVIALFFGQTSLAFAAPMLRSDACGEHETPGCPDDDCDCECPFDCTVCCVMQAVRAIPPLQLDGVLSVVSGEAVLGGPAEQRPPDAQPIEIFHVPKA